MDVDKKKKVTEKELREGQKEFLGGGILIGIGVVILGLFFGILTMPVPFWLKLVMIGLLIVGVFVGVIKFLYDYGYRK